MAAGQSVPVYGKRGIVAAAEPLAVDVGVAILKKGGNAVDAAVAVGFALAVTYPQAGNLGGGGFALMRVDGAVKALDFRETAPQAATRDMFLDERGDVRPGVSLNTILGVGVPGTVDGLERMHRAHGKLAWREVVEPAIELAREGFPVSEDLRLSLQGSQGRLGKHEPTRAVFYASGAAPGFGDVLKQPDLAESLERIKLNRRSGFYEGLTAELIVAEMGRGGGLITLEDLRGYASKWREPFTFQWAGYELHAMPLPSSGGITIAQILGMLTPDELKAVGLNSAHYIHRLTEAQRLAYADRNHFLGDSDFVKVPVERLTSARYLAERRKLMPEGRAGNSQGVAHGSPERLETTHYTVADEHGNVVAVTYTLNGAYGTGIVAAGTGILLNNEMDDFTAKPGVPNLYGLVQSAANQIEPGKRMLSSMTPMIVLKDGEFWMTAGSPGGSTIITTVLQIFLNMALFGMNIRDAIDTPRTHHQWLPDEIALENRLLSPDTLAGLEAMGYRLAPRGSLGMAAGIQRLPNGMYAGWADRRGAGKAAGF
jgi:gamma-glutamyltranspeptidase / glutathione hydrolase